MRRWISRRKAADAGFTLIELLVVIAVIGIIGAVAVPAFSGYYSECCVKAAVFEIAGMIKEGKQKALEEGDWAVIFEPTDRRVTLVSGRGGDGDWNTADDPVVRSFRLSDKGKGLKFGHGSHPKIPDYDNDPPDGISFQNNRLVCNERLTGNAGTVYICTTSGAAMALTMNSEDFVYTIRRWDGRKWVKM